VCLYMCHSFLVFSHRDCVCESIPTYLVMGLSFQYGVYPLFFLLCHVCCVSNMCCANLEFDLLFLIAWMCSLKRV
jgi:hypothetical protein